MKNPFQKNNRSGAWIAGLAASALLAGALKYLYSRKKDEVDEFAGQLKDHAKDYLHKKARNRTRSTLKGL